MDASPPALARAHTEARGTVDRVLGYGRLVYEVFDQRSDWARQALGDRKGLALDAAVMFVFGTMALASIHAATALFVGRPPADRLHFTILALAAVLTGIAVLHPLARLVRGTGTLRQTAAVLLVMGAVVTPMLGVLSGMETLVGRFEVEAFKPGMFFKFVGLAIMIGSIAWQARWLAAVHGIGERVGLALVVVWWVLHILFAAFVRQPLSDALTPLTNFLDAVF